MQEMIDHSAESSNKKSVKFSCVQVQEYERVIGCHPLCKSGMPLELGWAHSPSIRHTIDDYPPLPSAQEPNVQEEPTNTASRTPKNNRYVNNVKRLSFRERKRILKTVNGLSEDEVTLLERLRTEKLESDAIIYQEACRIKRDAARLEAQIKRRLRKEKMMQVKASVEGQIPNESSVCFSYLCLDSYTG